MKYVLKILQEEWNISENVLKQETIYVDDLIEDLGLMLKKIDEQFRPGHIVSAGEVEGYIAEFRRKEYVYELLGVKTEDIKKDVAKAEERLGNYKENVKFRARVADLLARAKKLKLEGKEFAVIPAS